MKSKQENKEKTYEVKSWLFENINKIDKPLATLIRKKRRKIINIKSERGDITINSTYIKKKTREYYQ